LKTQADRPRGFVIFDHSLKSGLTLPDESVARVFRAVARYFLDGAEPEDFDCAEQIVFDLMREDIDNSKQKHREVCARNRKIASTRSSRHGDSSPAAPADDDAPTVVDTDDDTSTVNADDNAFTVLTTRDDSYLIEKNRKEKEKSRKEQNREEKKKESTAAAPPTRAFGEFGWVKLTEPQYARLLEELGEEEALRCIRYVDESAQQTGNKNKWRDWNLVLRKCSREGWGRRKNNDKGGHLTNAGQSEKRRFSFRYDVE